ncbi:hypothetical protein ACSSS7_000158 [Eimeria intestinalis]
MVVSEEGQQAQASASAGVEGGAPPEEPMEADGAPTPSVGPPDEETCSESSFVSSDEALSPEETLAAAVSLKDAGNALFKEGKFSEALDKYQEGAKRLKRASSSEAIAVYVQLNSNSCMCCLKLERWQQALEAANKVLEKEPQNLKALYRRAVARGNLGRLQDAKDDLMEVSASATAAAATGSSSNSGISNSRSSSRSSIGSNKTPAAATAETTAAATAETTAAIAATAATATAAIAATAAAAAVG